MDLQTAGIEYDSEKKILDRGLLLRGMTFRDVLNLGIHPLNGTPSKFSERSKGRWGTFLEERFFAYKANSNPEPDFEDAGVELKTTCIDYRSKGPTAGERLVLTMISFTEAMPDSLYDSHLWRKCRRMLLVWYKRDKNIAPIDQRIKYVVLFTPPAKDLKIIEEDYRLIAGLIQAGRADELSEGTTTYLGACTKGQTAAKSLRPQEFYAPGKFAKRRAFSFKQPYMNYVLHHYVLGAEEPESIIDDPRKLGQKTLVQYVTDTINRYIGKTDRELAEMLGFEYTGDKAQWTKIAYRLLGIKGERAAEFEKAGIRVRTLRGEPGMKRMDKHVPILNIDFNSLAAETDWETSELRTYLDNMSFLFVAFEKTGTEKDAECVLKGCALVHVEENVLDGPIMTCWKRTVACLQRGVKIYPTYTKSGKFRRFENDLPAYTDKLVAHVRPRAKKSAYILEDGIARGNVERDAEQLPDGRWMTRQAFWLNKDYVLKRVMGKINERKRA